LSPPGKYQWLRDLLAPAEPPVATLDAPPARTDFKFPVLIYFAGLPSTGIQNFALIRELVSHGFVIATAIYPAILPGMSEKDHEQALKILERPLDYSSAAAAETSTRFFDARARSNAHDASMVLDIVSGLDTNDPTGRFTNRLDLDRAGVFGFPFGGATAAEARRVDSRFKAALNMGGWHFGGAAEQGVPWPYLFMMDDEWMISPNNRAETDPLYYAAAKDLYDYNHTLKNLERNGGLFIACDGLAHLNFTEGPLRSPIRRLSRGGGTIDARRAIRIVNTYVYAFFNEFLNGKPSPLLITEDPEFPEVHIRRWSPPSGKNEVSR
jgi:hypothetical protein